MLNRPGLSAKCRKQETIEPAEVIAMTTKIEPRTNSRRRPSTDPNRMNPNGHARMATRRGRRPLSGREIVITDRDHRRLETMIEEASFREGRLPAYLVELQGELGRACVVDSTRIPRDVVTMNSTACVRDLETDEIETYTLVYPESADISRGRISVLAPIGTALLGHCGGDVVEWPVPAGLARFKVEDVYFQPEREGSFDL